MKSSSEGEAAQNDSAFTDALLSAFQASLPVSIYYLQALIAHLQ